MSANEVQREQMSERLEEIRARMEKARHLYGTHAAGAELVAVSKTFPADAIRPLLALGQRVFGENRVGESLQKWPDLKRDFPGVELYLIGPLQTNKVADAVALFDVIQTLDREKLARYLAREMERTGRVLPCFVQVNVGREPQKSGVDPDEAVAFVQLCRKTYGLKIAGLMCIPPRGENPGPYFAMLGQLAQQAGVDQLSMGMSADFEIAIGMGATHIRVGTALFGDR